MSLNLIVNAKHFTFKQLSSTITVVVLYIIKDISSPIPWRKSMW